MIPGVKYFGLRLHSLNPITRKSLEGRTENELGRIADKEIYQ